MKKLFLLLLLVPCIAVARPISTGTTLYQKKYEDWQVLLLRFDDNELTFRAVSVAQNDQSLLGISVSTADCDSYVVDLTGIMNTPLDADINTDPQMITPTRIDEGKIYNGKVVRLMGNLGEKDIHSYINYGSSSTEFFNNMVKGKTLRIKFDFPDGTSAIERFGMKGSALALKQINYVCHEVQNKRKSSNDDSFFPKKTDKDFFEVPQSKQTQEPVKNNDQSFFRNI